jgi:hypothetical protein
MCPVCVSTAALITASVTSTGGIAAVIVRRLFSNKQTTNHCDPGKNEEEKHG